MGDDEISQLKEKYFPTFVFFEYRKIIRRLGGELFEKGTHPIIVGGVILLWIFEFVITNIYLDGQTLVFSFYSAPTGVSGSKVIAWLQSAIITQTLLLIIIATYWQIRRICEVFLIILFVTTIADVALKGSTQDFHPYGNPIILYVSASFLTCVTLYYVFNYYFAPLIILWRYGHIVNYKFESDDSDEPDEPADGLNPESMAQKQSRVMDPHVKDLVIEFPYLSTIFMTLFIFFFFPYWPAIVGFIGFSLLASAVLSVPEWEFLNISIFYRLEQDYWIFEKLNDDTTNQSSHNIGDKIAYYPHQSWYSLRRLFEKPSRKKKSSYFQYKGSHESVRSGSISSSQGVARTLSLTCKQFLEEVRGREFGKPHGYGEWKDSEVNGETCGGMFSRGTPIAPFLTREKLGQGTFRNHRIGFVTITDGKVNEIDQGLPRFIPSDNGYNGLCFGAAEVECCVSGTFYYSFPRTNFLLHSLPPKVSLSVSDTWKCLMEPYIIDKSKNEFSKTLQYDVNMVSTEAESITFSSSSDKIHEIILKVEEVLIFIPGFNSCLHWSLNTYGQFLQLAGFPNSISPFLFCWPQVSEFMLQCYHVIYIYFFANRNNKYIYCLIIGSSINIFSSESSSRS